MTRYYRSNTQEAKLIAELANDLIQAYLAMAIEGSVYTSIIGKPVDTPNGPIGRACHYLGQSIPIIPPWDQHIQEIYP